jgi:hypothetical protein
LMDFLLKRCVTCNMRNIPFICHQKSMFLFSLSGGKGSLLKLLSTPLAGNRLNENGVKYMLLFP